MRHLGKGLAIAGTAIAVAITLSICKPLNADTYLSFAAPVIIAYFAYGMD